MAAQVKPVETPEQKWFRSLAKGRADGCEILIESSTDEVFVTSGTVAGVIYRVTAETCTCQGFLSYQRCKHVAIYRYAIGLIVEPDPDPVANAALLTARAELARMESLSNRNKLKSTADFRNLDTARAKVDELSAAIPYPLVNRTVAPVTSYAAD